MSCLFKSLSYFFPNITEQQLRHVICNYLQRNLTVGCAKAKEVIKWESGVGLQEYVNNMRKSSTWGGAIEIKCFCDILKRNVIVNSIPNNKQIQFLSSTPNVPTLRIYWTGGHYEPIK